MVFKGCRTIYLTVFILLAHTCTSRAGNVITNETREWARKTLQEEKSLKTVEAKNSLAVLYFQNKTGQEELDQLQKGFALMLITDLSSVKGMQVIERIKLQALVEEIGLGASGLVDSNTAPRVGKLLQAQWLAGGNITGSQQSKLRIKSDLLNVPTAKVVGQPASEGMLPELFRIEKELLFEIIKLLNIKVTPEEEVRLRKPCSTNSKALFALFTGVDASDHEEYEKAATLYNKALKDDPNVCLAGEALNELHDLGLISEKKKSGGLLRSLRDSTSLTNQLTPKEEIKREFTPKDATTTITIDVVIPTPPAQPVN